MLFRTCVRMLTMLTMPVRAYSSKNARTSIVKCCGLAGHDQAASLGSFSVD